MSDQQLVHAYLRTRSEQAFLDLYRSKTPHLYRMALRLTQDEDQSHELLQDMWVVAIRKLEGFEWRSELKTWLIGILINLFRAKRKSEERMLAEEAIPMEVETSELDWIQTHDLEKAISELPAGYRQIIILHDIEGYKHKEIAELLDISEGTSKSQLFHARKTMRNYLKDEIKVKGHE